MACYYKADLVLQSIDEDEWLHTGDLGFFDDEGYLHFVGRSKELIIRGGENIIPNEVAAAISENENIADVKVFGAPDDFWGEIVVAAITLKDGADFDQAAIKNKLSLKLAKYKIPSLFLLYESFPLLPNGKVDAVGLKKDALQRIASIGGVRSAQRKRIKYGKA